MVPDWLFTERYDIVAVTGNDAALTDENRQAYLQAALADRCQFRFHRETREIRMYALVSSKNGPKLIEHSGPGEYSMRVQPTDEGHLRLRSTRGNMRRFGRDPDRTGWRIWSLTAQGCQARYDFTLEWAPNLNDSAPGPSLFTALDEQLGLRLEAAKSPVQAIVIDRIERPSEN